MSGGEFLMWLHLCAMASYVGAQFAVIYMLIPAAETAPNEAARRASLIAGFKFYNPFTIGVLGIIVISGAMRLTDSESVDEVRLLRADRFGAGTEAGAGVPAHLHPDLHHVRTGVQDRPPGRGGRTWRRRGVHRRTARTRCCGESARWRGSRSCWQPPSSGYRSRWSRAQWTSPPPRRASPRAPHRVVHRGYSCTR